MTIAEKQKLLHRVESKFVIRNKFTFMPIISFPYGLVVMIAGTHLAGPGSIPGVETHFFCLDGDIIQSEDFQTLFNTYRSITCFSYILMISLESQSND